MENVDEDAISDELALLAGYRSAAELIHELRDRPLDATFVVRFHVVAGPDPRTVLAETQQPRRRRRAGVLRTLGSQPCTTRLAAQRMDD